MDFRDRKTGDAVTEIAHPLGYRLPALPPRAAHRNSRPERIRIRQQRT